MILEYEIKVTISICSSGVEVWNSTFILQGKVSSGLGSGLRTT